MGGSGGGGGYFSSDPRETLRKLKAAQSATQDAEYDARCNDALRGYLGHFNNRNADAISRHLDEIKDILEEDLDRTVDLRFGGSVAKHTYVDGLSDIDSLVLLDRCDLAERPPAEARNYVAERLAEGLHAEVDQGRLAVTVRFNDAEIQLLPAVSCQGGVQIADASGTNWARIDPSRFSQKLSAVNADKGQKVVPVIKLAKGVIANLPERKQITGYHTESLAVEIFQAYDGPLTHKAMLRHFFEQAAAGVRSPIRDSTGQSVHVDDYLGRENSLERRILSDAFARIGRRMANADASKTVEEWNALFGE